jgi:hypothetical protein
MSRRPMNAVQDCLLAGAGLPLALLLWGWHW